MPPIEPVVKQISYNVTSADLLNAVVINFQSPLFSFKFLSDVNYDGITNIQCQESSLDWTDLFAVNGGAITGYNGNSGIERNFSVSLIFPYKIRVIITQKATLGNCLIDMGYL